MGSEKGKNTVLKALRIANDYTVKQVVDLSGCTTSTIHASESDYRPVTYKTVEKIVKIYNLDIVQAMELVKYYDSLKCDETKKYQYTLLRVLQVLLKNQREGEKNEKHW